MNSFSLYPSITKPTRITSKTATLIDNIFTNSYSKQTAGLILTDISDHLPIFISTNLTVYEKDNKGTKVNARDVNDENIRNFKNKLCQVDWDNVCNSTDVDVSYSCFIEKFNLLYNECFPIKSLKKRIRINKPKSPWITYSLLKSIRRKNLLYRNSIQKPSESNISKYKNYRNKLNTLLRLAKQNYFSSQLDREKHNMKNTWKILNSILRSSKKSISDKFVSNGNIINEPKQIADGFNKYFANIGPLLANSIKHNGNDFTHYLEGSHFSSTCYLKPTDENEILKIIGKLGSNKSPGHDNIKSDLVKQIASEISYPLKLICNLSLSTGVFPNDLKIAKVVPIYKKDNPENFGNYRPVSVLPCFSKILERIMYNRCYDFITKTNVLFKKQYGFRNKHSTYMAVLDFVININHAIDNDKYTLAVFMDLSKAFDTIDHSILLSKLYHCGFRGISYDWFASYLSNRKQYVSYQNTKSSYENVICGVPQGSILGPLLFILYMNDICFTSSLLKFILFADDTTVIYLNDDISVLYDTVNRELNEVCNWFKCNKLSLNASKTNLMLMATTYKIRNIQNVKAIFLDGCKLMHVSSAKFFRNNYRRNPDMETTY